MKMEAQKASIFCLCWFFHFDEGEISVFQNRDSSTTLRFGRNGKPKL
jgi:hypothetical protein